MQNFKKSIFLLGALLCALGASTTVQATENDTPGFSIGPDAGTLGYGVEAGYRFNQYFGTRASWNKFDFSHTGKVNGVSYKGKLHLNSEGLVGDIYPFGGGWRVALGARLQDNSAKANAQGDVIINGNNYGTAALDGKVTYKNKVAPYVGLGYLGTLFSGLQLSGEIGAMYQGQSKVSLNNPDGLISANDVASQIAKIKHYANDLEIYPVVQLALVYHF